MKRSFRTKLSLITDLSLIKNADSFNLGPTDVAPKIEEDREVPCHPLTSLEEAEALLWEPPPNRGETTNRHAGATAGTEPRRSPIP
jgi:hypothetical protein